MRFSKKGAVTDQMYFMIANALLITLIIAVFFLKINDLSKNKDVFYNYHSDEITSLAEALTTENAYSGTSYDFADFNFCTLKMKKESDDRRTVSMGTGVSRTLLLPKSYEINFEEMYVDDTKNEIFCGDAYKGVQIFNEENTIKVIPMGQCLPSVVSGLANFDTIDSHSFSAQTSYTGVNGKTSKLSLYFFSPSKLSKDQLNDKDVSLFVLTGNDNYRCDITNSLKAVFDKAKIFGSHVKNPSDYGYPDGYDVYVFIK